MTNPGLNGLILGVLAARHPVRLPAGDAALPRDPLGQRLPHRRSRASPSRTSRCCWRRWRPCCATAPARCRCRPRRCARSWTRSARASTKRATPAAISSACWSSSACSAPSGACSRRSSRSARRSTRSTPRPPTTSPMFDELKTGLAAPLKGMGTAFSSSLLGLSGSLVLGFLELQASHAHNRFYNELEEWLSGITELTPAATGVSSDQVNRQLLGAVLRHAARGRGSDRRGSPTSRWPAPSRRRRRRRARARAGRAASISSSRQMRAEQKVVREWVDEQAAQQSRGRERAARASPPTMQRGGLDGMARGRSRGAAASTASSGRATSTCCRRCCWSSPS